MKMTVPLEIGLVVQNIDAMVDFYTQIIGLRVVSDDRAVSAKSAAVRTTPHGYRIVRMQTPYGERIKFVQTDADPPAPAPVPQWVYQRHGLCYLTFVIADLPEMAEKLKKHGVRVLSEPIEIRKGVFALNLVDPEGNFIEFVEQADPQLYRADLFKWKQFF